MFSMASLHYWCTWEFGKHLPQFLMSSCLGVKHSKNCCKCMEKVKRLMPNILRATDFQSRKISIPGLQVIENAQDKLPKHEKI